MATRPGVEVKRPNRYATKPPGSSGSTQYSSSRVAVAVAGLQLVFISRTRLSTVGDRAFPVAAARVWNSLPEDVTSTRLSSGSSSSSSSSDAKRSAEASRRCDCSPERSVIR